MSQIPPNLTVAKRPPAKELQVACMPANDSPHSIVSKSNSSPPKKAQVAPVPVESSSLPIAIHSKVSPPKTAEVVHIPAKGPLSIFRTSIIEIDHGNAPNAHTAATEQSFRQVPNIRGYKVAFKWDSRSLLARDVKGPATEGGWAGKYLVYKCIDSGAGLPVNEHFEPVADVRPYGDVFVFRFKKMGKSGRAKYGTMERDFLRNYYHHGVARAILTSLGACKPGDLDCKPWNVEGGAEEKVNLR